MDYDLIPDRINMDELHKRRTEVARLKEGVFRKILSRAHLKIKQTARLRCDDQFCFFLVPEFLIGTPLYDSAACVAYIIGKLNDNGFVVKYTHPNLLFISWRHHIGKAARQTFKKTYGVGIDGMGRRLPPDKERAAPQSPDTLILKKMPPSVTIKKKGGTFKDTSSYKPTGALIYNQQLLQSIEDKTRRA